jgi:hypothetical protein
MWPEWSFVATLMVCAMIDLIIFIVCVSFSLWVIGVLGLIVWGARCLVGVVAGNDVIEQAERRRTRRHA